MPVVFICVSYLLCSAVFIAHAKCDIAIACRPSVCDVGGSWPNGLAILETNCTDN